MAPTRRPYLAFINFTEHDIEVVNYGDIPDDFEGDARPSKQFPPWTIVKPFKRIERILETIKFANGSDVKIDIRFKRTGPFGETMQTLQFDQQDAFRWGADFNGIRQKISCHSMQVDAFRIAYDDHQYVLTVPWMTMDDSANWMRSLPNERSIFHMLLPGTHDSAAHGGHPVGDLFGISVSSSQCQDKYDWKMKDQFDRGIRAVDIRFKRDGNSIVSEHGGINMGYSAPEVFGDIATWLKQHPTEFCIAKVRAKDADVSKEIQVLLNKDRAQYWTEARWPKDLGEARGKCIVLNDWYPKEHLHEPRIGLIGNKQDDSLLWGDNVENEQFEIAGKKICVQDVYSMSDLQLKSKKIEAMLQKSMGIGDGSDADWFFNFMSAATWGSQSPFDFATGHDNKGILGMNRWLLHRFCRYEVRAPMSAVDFAGNSRIPRGIIFMDFYKEPDNICTLQQAIIALNHGYNFESPPLKTSVGAWKGGKGGAEFNTMSGWDTVNDKFISAVHLRCGNRIDAIKLVWSKRGSSSIEGDWKGGSGGGEHRFDTRGERIVKITGYADYRINQIQFHTSSGKSSEVYGSSTDGEMFEWRSPDDKSTLIGFQGRSGWGVDGLAPIWAVSEFALEQKQSEVKIQFDSWAGGQGGGSFNTMESLGEADNKQIAAISARHGNRVDAIQLRWWNRNGNPGSIDGKWQGGSGGGTNTWETGGHRITKVEGYADYRINQIHFCTHEGNWSPKFGRSTAGKYFMWETKEKDGALLGFQGRSGDSVDGLSPIWISNSDYAREHG